MQINKIYQNVSHSTFSFIVLQNPGVFLNNSLWNLCVIIVS